MPLPNSAYVAYVSTMAQQPTGTGPNMSGDFSGRQDTAYNVAIAIIGYQLLKGILLAFGATHGPRAMIAYVVAVVAIFIAGDRP